MDGQMDWWINEWMDRQMDGWIDEWMKYTEMRLQTDLILLWKIDQIFILDEANYCRLCSSGNSLSKLEFSVQDVYQGVSLSLTPGKERQGEGLGTGRRWVVMQAYGSLIWLSRSLWRKCFFKVVLGLGKIALFSHSMDTGHQGSLQLGHFWSGWWLLGTPLRSLADSGAYVFKVTWAMCLHVLHILPLIQMLNSYRYAW